MTVHWSDRVRASVMSTGGKICDKIFGSVSSEAHTRLWPVSDAWEDDLWREDLGGPVNRAREFGLRLPNGTEIWPPVAYRGHRLDTAGARATLLAVLKKTAGDLDFVESEFLTHYRWIMRDAITGILPVTSPLAYVETEQETGRDDNDTKLENTDPAPSPATDTGRPDSVVVGSSSTNGDSGGSTSS